MSFRERLGYLLPDRSFSSTQEAFVALEDEQGLEGVVVDLDGVLINVDGDHSNPELGVNVDEEVFSGFETVLDDYGACILTNRSRYDSFNASKLCDFFKAEIISIDGSNKPNQDLFEKAIDSLGCEVPENVVMVGDSPYTDIYGGNKAGMVTYQVDQDRNLYGFPERYTKGLEDALQSLASYLEN